MPARQLQVMLASSPLARIWGECSAIHSPLALLLLLLPLLLLQVEIKLAYSNSTLLSQGQSTVAQRAETTAIEWSLTSTV